MQWLARLPGKQEIRGSSHGRGMTDFCTSIFICLYIYIYIYIYIYQSTLNVEQSTRTITLAFILLELFPFELIKLCLLSNLKTAQDIFMKLHSNISQQFTTCKVQE